MSLASRSVGRVLALTEAGAIAWVEGARRDVTGAGLAAGDLIAIERDGRAICIGRPDPGADAFAADGDLARLLADDGRRDRALRERATMLAAIRATFDRRGFVEVETPAIALSPGMELHLDAIGVDVREGMGGAMTRRWLVTSPELHCKRLLHAGVGQIYSLAKAFRSGERGGWHNPEFTMLEWYRAGAEVDVIIDDVLALIRRVASSLARQRRARGVALPIWRPKRVLRLSFLQALRRFADIDAADDAGRCADLPTLWRLAAAKGVDVRPGDDEATVLLAIFATLVEPALQAHDCVVITPWPASLASLSRPVPGAPWLAERFEIYLRGVELANGFGELVDAAEQERRLHADVAARVARGMAVYPIDTRFLQALQRGCPPSAGVALGVDRLLMAVGGYDDIDEVLVFPFERA